MPLGISLMEIKRIVFVANNCRISFVLPAIHRGAAELLTCSLYSALAPVSGLMALPSSALCSVISRDGFFDDGAIGAVRCRMVLVLGGATAFGHSGGLGASNGGHGGGNDFGELFGQALGSIAAPDGVAIMRGGWRSLCCHPR
jgi:hypothetical protein